MRALGLILTLLVSWTSMAAEQKTLTDYIQFIEEWSNYEYNGEALPEVKYISQGYLQLLTYGDYEVAQAEYKGEELPVINSAYDSESKTIYMSKTIDPNSVTAELALLHEMVHYVQDISGYTESLDGHLVCTESEAYDIQIVYQVVNNVSPETVRNYYALSVLAATKCMGSKFQTSN